MVLRNFSLQNKRKSLRVQLARADIIHSQREIEVVFSTLKNSPFPVAHSINLHIRACFLFPALFPAIAVKNLKENLATLTI